MFYPFGGLVVSKYRPTLEHFIVNPPMSVHCENFYNCSYQFMLSVEKNLTSPSQIQLILELLGDEKPGFFM